MKVLNKVVIGMASLCLLTACGPTKVSYDKFHEKAAEAAKAENGYTKCKVNGSAKYSDNGKTVEYKFDNLEFDGYKNGRYSAADALIKEAALLLEGEVKVAAFTLSLETAEIVPNDSHCVYYTGGLKVTNEEDGNKETVKFDSNGLPVEIVFAGNESGKVTFSWSK